MADANLVARIGSACVFVPAVLVLVAVGGWALLALVLAIVGRASWEYAHMCRAAGRDSVGWLGTVLAMLLCLYAHQYGANGWLAPLTATALIVPLAALRRGPDQFLYRTFGALGAVLYLGLLGSAPLLIARGFGPERASEVGYLLIAVLGGIWLSDSAAYFAGRRWGHRKLAPVISPGKTVVGFVAGLFASLVPAALYSFVPSLAPIQLLGLLFATGLAGQLGDLVESAIKRDLGVKDAPVLIPGHGGALDRFDSYFLAFPVAYLVLLALGHFQ